MSVINFPLLYIPDPNKGRPLFNGQIFVGEPDLDPEITDNQKQLNVVTESGAIVPVNQPFTLSAGGVPTYNGKPVRLDVDGNYSIKILNRLGAQEYYIENVYEGQPVTSTELEEALLPTIKRYTLAEAKALTDAVIGQIIQITDRGDGQFKFIAPTTNNEFDLIENEGSGLTIQLADVPTTANVGVPSDGVASAIAGLTRLRELSNVMRISDGQYLFDSTTKSLFDSETTLIFDSNATFVAADGVEVLGNSCLVDADLKQHFQHNDYDTQWQTGVSYTVGDVVQFEYGRYYKCLLDHTSGTWWNGSTGDKDTGKFVSFAPFSFFQRKDADFFVYPEWFGAKADGNTLSSVGFAKAMSCNSVFASLKLNELNNNIINGYYRLSTPLVILNGRTLYGGEVDRSPALLRIDGNVWVGGDLGISTEEVEDAPGNVLGYSSIKNVRFQIENIANANFQWFKGYFLETTKCEQMTWQFIGANEIKQEAEFLGGPTRVTDLNIVYGDEGIVQDHPLYLNLFNGGIVRNINYKNQKGQKGLKIRPGRFTDISGIFIENSPEIRSEAALYIEQSGNSNGRIGEIYINNDRLNDSDALALEVESNLSLSSFVSNVNIENVTIFPHDGVGSPFDNAVKINGINYTKAQLQDSTGSNVITIAKLNANEFKLAGLRNQFTDAPASSSWHYASIPNGNTESITFSPTLRQGTNADSFNSWCGMVMISSRGATDQSYCAFVGLVQNSAGGYDSTVTELAGSGRWSVTWNTSTAQWDVTNTNGSIANQVVVSFLNQGPNNFIK